MFFKRQPVNVYAAQMPMGDGMMAGMPGAAGMAAMPGMAGAPGMAAMPGMAGAPGMAAMPGMAGAPGMAGVTEVSGYAYPGQFMHAGMPGFEASGFAGPGMSEAVHAVRTEYDVPGYPPVHYGHTELDVELQPHMHHKIYVVRKGDTVYKIAKQYGLDWRELAGYNHLGNPDLIYPGQRLFIPPRF